METLANELQRSSEDYNQNYFTSVDALCIHCGQLEHEIPTETGHGDNISLFEPKRWGMETVPAVRKFYVNSWDLRPRQLLQHQIHVVQDDVQKRCKRENLPCNPWEHLPWTIPCVEDRSAGRSLPLEIIILRGKNTGLKDKKAPFSISRRSWPIIMKIIMTHNVWNRKDCSRVHIRIICSGNARIYLRFDRSCGGNQSFGRLL